MQRQSDSRDACFLGDVVWLLSLAFLLASRGHGQLHQQPCALAALLPAKMSNALPGGAGRRGWVSAGMPRSLA